MKVVAETVKTLAETVKDDRIAAAAAVDAAESLVHKIDKAAGERMAIIETTLKAISGSMGIKPTEDGTMQPVKRFGSQPPGVVIAQIVGASGGAMLLVKAVGPPFMNFIQAVWTAIVH